MFVFLKKMEISLSRVRKGGVRLVAVMQEEFVSVVADVLEALETRGESFLERLKWALGTQPIQAQNVRFIISPTWKINVGGRMPVQLVSMLTFKMKLSGEARFLMEQPCYVLPEQSRDHTFIELSLSDLGFTSKPRTTNFMTEDFCARWSAEKLQGGRITLCEKGDAPHLRLAFSDQKPGQTSWVAMERLPSNMGDHVVFKIKCDHDGNQWLSTNSAGDSLVWPLDMKIIFRYYSLPQDQAIPEVLK
jgi:hypothetical protein